VEVDREVGWPVVLLATGFLLFLHQFSAQTSDSIPVHVPRVRFSSDSLLHCLKLLPEYAIVPVASTVHCHVVQEGKGEEGEKKLSLSYKYEGRG
jgi:hypothetical protein